MSMGKTLLWKRLTACYRGSICWHRITKKYAATNYVYILFPSEDKEITDYALFHLKDLLEKRKAIAAVLITTYKDIRNNVHYPSKLVAGIEYVNQKDIDSLMQFYCLYNFDMRFIIASLNEPNGNNAWKMVGLDGVSREEVFVSGIYSIYPFLSRKETQ